MTRSGVFRVSLPDRVTVLTCIGCGAMGREERCDGDCSEHKLLLITAVDYDELLGAAYASRVRSARLASAVREFHRRAGAARQPARRTSQAARRSPAGDARRRTRRAPCRLDPAGDGDRLVVRGVPATSTCPSRVSGSVSGVRRTGLSRLLARAGAVTPRVGEWQRNLDAFRAQARAALEDFIRDSPAPEAPPVGAPRNDPDPARR